MNTITEPNVFRPPGYAQRFHNMLPAGCTLAWGARAIYRLDFASRLPAKSKKVPKGSVVSRNAGSQSGYVASVDIVWDRHEMVGGVSGSDERKAFAEWIDKTGLPSIRFMLADQRISTRDNSTVEFGSEHYHIIASPNGSYGYLYILAWRKP